MRKMRLINFLSKLDSEENKDMHFVIGFNCYNENAYFTEWFQNKEALLSQPNTVLKRNIKSFWINCKVNTICIELR